MSSIASSDIEVVRHARVRGYRLSVDPASGRTRLTLPARAALKPALAWAGDKAAWIAEQRARLPTPRPFVDGAVLPVADRDLLLVREEGSRRALVRDGDRLLIAGPEDTVARRVEAWLRRQALDLLAAETHLYAAKAGVTITHVAVGDAKGRWGSCASSGSIRYSWRLLLAPGHVRRATVAHEVAHRVHMNHSPAFHTLVAQLFEGDPDDARAWLRANGAALHWFGKVS